MSIVTESAVSLPVKSGCRSPSFVDRLSKLPEELIVEILEYALFLLGPISKKNFWAGKCEWPGCFCESSDWEHVTGNELMNKTLLPWLMVPQPIPRLARYVYYTSNTFHVCDPRSDMDWTIDRRVWLPPQGARQWIQRLEIDILLESPLLRPFKWDSAEYGRDVSVLRQMQRAVDGFPRLKILRLMFDATFCTEDYMLERLDHTWFALEPFRFATPELLVEACSAYAEQGNTVRDDRLQSVLARHVFATGLTKRIDV